MPVSQNDAGSQTAVINTEHTLKSLSVDGTYMLFVDLSNMLAGDRVELRTKNKIKAAGSEIELLNDVIIGDDIVGGVQTKLYYGMPIPTTETMSYALKQTHGTGRVFDWQVLQV